MQFSCVSLIADFAAMGPLAEIYISFLATASCTQQLIYKAPILEWPLPKQARTWHTICENHKKLLTSPEKVYQVRMFPFVMSVAHGKSSQLFSYIYVTL